MNTPHNIMEDVVVDLMKEKRADLNACCESAELDIMAIVLNKFPPHYVNTEEGEVYARSRHVLIKDRMFLLASIIWAAEFVKENPRCKCGEA